MRKILALLALLLAPVPALASGWYSGIATPWPVATGGTNCVVASITCFNNITGFTAAGTTGTTSTNIVFSGSPALTTPTFTQTTDTTTNASLCPLFMSTNTPEIDCANLFYNPNTQTLNARIISVDLPAGYGAGNLNVGPPLFIYPAAGSDAGFKIFRAGSTVNVDIDLHADHVTDTVVEDNTNGNYSWRIAGTERLGLSASALNIPTGSVYQINGSQIAAANLSNGTSGSGAVCLVTSCVMVTPTLGAALATTINGNTFTTGTYTLTGVAAKTLTFNNSITLAGTDGTTMTFPATSKTVMASDYSNASTTTLGSTTLTMGGTTSTIGGLTLTAPTLGVASSTSLAAGACTIGTNTLCSNGTTLLTGATTMSAALTYGGVTLSNAVTGTGNMVLSATQTFTGTMTAAIANFSGLVSPSLGITVTGAVASLNASSNFGTNINTGTSTGAIAIGNSSHTGLTSLLGLTTGTAADTLCLTAGGLVLLQAAACTISDPDLKTDKYVFTGSVLNAALKMPTWTFRLKDWKTNRDPNARNIQLGLMAPDVQKFFPLCSEFYSEGPKLLKKPKSWKQDCMIAVLFKGLQEKDAKDQAEIASLKATLKAANDNQKSLINFQQQEIYSLASRVAKLAAANDNVHKALLVNGR